MTQSARFPFRRAEERLLAMTDYKKYVEMLD